ncbi:hypothetical protein M0804_004531 [Polistes exclamans]|nr:hypothetical protein M0804_004531 [Polistes exclamans]
MRTIQATSSRCYGPGNTAKSSLESTPDRRVASESCNSLESRNVGGDGVGSDVTAGDGEWYYWMMLLVERKCIRQGST